MVLLAGFTEFLSFFVIVVNTRAFTQGKIGWTMATDGLFIIQTWAVGKWMVEDKQARGIWALLGFLIGGELGSVLGIVVTKYFYGG